MPFLRRRRQKEEAEFQMAPMIDIVFLLLVFFISVTKFKILETELKVTVPGVEKKVQSAIPPPQEIVIEVKPETILINNTPWTLPKLEQKLMRISEIDKEQRIIILGDKDALHEEVIDVLNCCSRADLVNVSLASP